MDSHQIWWNPNRSTTMMASAMVSAPPATSRAEVSLTGFGKLNNLRTADLIVDGGIPSNILGLLAVGHHRPATLRYWPLRAYRAGRGRLHRRQACVIAVTVSVAE